MADSNSPGAAADEDEMAKLVQGLKKSPGEQPFANYPRDPATGRPIITVSFEKNPNLDYGNITEVVSMPQIAQDRANQFILPKLQELFDVTFVTVSGNQNAFMPLLQGNLSQIEVSSTPDGKPYDLQLLPAAKDVNSIPKTGNKQVIVATINNVLHFRIFDNDGNMVVDTNETQSPGQTQKIEDLRKQFNSLQPSRALTETEKEQVINATTSIVGHQDAKGSYKGAGAVSTWDNRGIIVAPSDLKTVEAVDDALFHEIGHRLLKLKHPYTTLNNYGADRKAHLGKSGMSYNDPPPQQNYQPVRPVGLRVPDVLAGQDTVNIPSNINNLNSGNTTYTTQDLFGRRLPIWDTSGNNTLDLRPGSTSINVVNLDERDPEMRIEGYAWNARREGQGFNAQFMPQSLPYLRTVMLPDGYLPELKDGAGDRVYSNTGRTGIIRDGTGSDTFVGGEPVVATAYAFGDKPGNNMIYNFLPLVQTWNGGVVDHQKIAVDASVSEVRIRYNRSIPLSDGTTTSGAEIIFNESRHPGDQAPRTFISGLTPEQTQALPVYRFNASDKTVVKDSWLQVTHEEPVASIASTAPDRLVINSEYFRFSDAIHGAHRSIVRKGGAAAVMMMTEAERTTAVKEYGGKISNGQSFYTVTYTDADNNLHALNLMENAKVVGIDANGNPTGNAQSIKTAIKDAPAKAPAVPQKPPVEEKKIPIEEKAPPVIEKAPALAPAAQKTVVEKPKDPPPAASTYDIAVQSFSTPASPIAGQRDTAIMLAPSANGKAVVKGADRVGASVLQIHHDSSVKEVTVKAGEVTAASGPGYIATMQDGDYRKGAAVTLQFTREEYAATRFDKGQDASSTFTDFYISNRRGSTRSQIKEIQIVDANGALLESKTLDVAIAQKAADALGRAAPAAEAYAADAKPVYVPQQIYTPQQVYVSQPIYAPQQQAYAPNYNAPYQPTGGRGLFRRR